MLVTGGAGYIGSVVAAMLLEAGHQVSVVDDLSVGHADAVPEGARFVQADLFEADISEATVVTLFLLTRLNQQLMPKLKRELRPGTRIVSHQFRMDDTWPPEESQDVNGLMIYLWTIK